MDKNLHKAGIIVSASIPIFVLPARISEGQWKDPVNLIGSEIVIFFMCLAGWYCINIIQQKKYGRWQGLLLSVLCCCILSNLFYFIFNPFFKDFPFRTPQKQLIISILMLCSRGFLMSLILIPAAYFLKKDREARFQRQENARLAMEKVKIENRLLERAVLERTLALQEALNTLEKSQGNLEHQLYIQSRLVASITHDIRGPFNFLVIVSGEIRRLADKKEYNDIGQYSSELHKALEKMYGFVQDMLEFTKLPVHQKLAISDKVNLAQIIEEKSELFEGIIQTNDNKLMIDVDPSITVKSNINLLGIVLHNLIDNANKHSSNGNIKVSALVKNSAAQIVIENTGSSVPDVVIQWLNSSPDEISPYNPSVDTQETVGIGLILIKEITSLLNIQLFMQSGQTATKVFLTFQQNFKHSA